MSSDNHKAEVVKKIASFPDGGKHRLPAREGGYARSEIITSSPYNNQVEMKQPTQVRKKKQNIQSANSQATTKSRKKQ